MAILHLISSFSVINHISKNFTTRNPPFGFASNVFSSHCLKLRARKHQAHFSAKDDNASSPSSSSTVTAVSEQNERKAEIEIDSSVSVNVDEEEESEEKTQQQEVDWKTDEEFKKFMGNPSIEAAIKLEKKRADRKLKELDKQAGGNPIANFFVSVIRDSLAKEKERLEKAEETFKSLDLNKLKNCFGYDTFFAVDVRRFGDGGIFIGNLRKPIEEVMPRLEKKLSKAAGREVVIWFMQEQTNEITKQVCMVQPKAEIDLQFEFTKLSTPWGYVSAIVLCVATFGTIALMSGFFLKPDATFEDYVADVLPLFGGFLSILGVSEVDHLIYAPRLTKENKSVGVGGVVFGSVLVLDHLSLR